jgi:two-component system chemotaxis response regulator CheB
MVVDDAVVVRGLVGRWIEAEPDLRLAATLRNGQEAVDQLERTDPDVVVLDVDMPHLDGISALPLLLEKKRDLVVIMASTLTRRNAEVSLRALSLGAADYIPKPQTNRDVVSSTEFHRDLIEKIRQLGGRRKRVAEIRMRRAGLPVREPLPEMRPAGPTTYSLRPFSPIVPRVLLIGTSTGGPQALTALLGQIDSVIDRAPVLVTQHMPPTFTTILAEHLARASKRPAHEARDGEVVKPGTVYLAPGGRHMRVVRRNGHVEIALDDGPMVHFCRPAVDPLFTSAAQAWGSGVLALILTGMGTDGTQGAAQIVAAGGSVMAQDEATSVVWGMPGSAAHAGVCSAVLPLQQISGKVTTLFSGGRL